MKIGNKLWPIGTEVKAATLEEVRAVFPNIVANEGSSWIAVWLPDMPHPTLMDRMQIKL